jgi:hypothetical protein
MNERTLAACGSIKATGNIRIYTVGFQLRDKDAVALLRSCASEESTAFPSDTNSELIKTFEKIAMDISTLRIVK